MTLVCSVLLLNLFQTLDNITGSFISMVMSITRTSASSMETTSPTPQALQWALVSSKTAWAGGKTEE
jgi:hypothetical protein